MQFSPGTKALHGQRPADLRACFIVANYLSMNPHSPHPVSLATLIRNLWKNRQLIFQMTKREVIGRYKGSVLGMGWSFFNPLLMLALYTFVFSVVFKARWGIAKPGEPESRAMFAIILFIGLIVHSLFSEILSRAPGLITSNASYVKKVVFPLEILPVIAAGAALFHAGVSIAVWLIAYVIFIGIPHWNFILLPLIIFPMLLLALGMAWFLASLGVFLRDVGQTIAILLTVLMFTAPIFFPVTNLPERIQPWIMLNPLTFIIVEARAVAVWGQLPDIKGWLIYTACASMIAWFGFVWFQRTRKGFADVL